MKHTSQMNREELARAWSEHHHLQGRAGGWIYQGDLPIAHGYDALGASLERLGIIRVGTGILWRKEPPTPVLAARRAFQAGGRR
jgi:hypothetical protein